MSKERKNNKTEEKYVLNTNEPWILIKVFATLSIHAGVNETTEQKAKNNNNYCYEISL